MIHTQTLRQHYSSRVVASSQEEQITHTTTSTRSHKMSHATTTTTCCVLAAIIVLAFASISSGLQQQQQQQLSGADVAALQQPQPLSSIETQEMLVRPNTEVRLECRLPHLESSQTRIYYWHYVRSPSAASLTASTPQQKTIVLCQDEKCFYRQKLGYDDAFDKSTGGYDLTFHNVTHELNDGLYSCNYRDENPASERTYQRDIHLIVLSKYTNLRLCELSC